MGKSQAQESAQPLDQTLSNIIQSISSKRKEIEGEYSECSVCGNNRVHFTQVEQGETVCRWCLREKEELDQKEKQRIHFENMCSLEKQYRAENIERYLLTVGVSKRYSTATLSGFSGGKQYVDFCRSWLMNPQSLYLYGPCGCGKTHLSSALCRELLLGCEAPHCKNIPKDISSDNSDFDNFLKHEYRYGLKNNTSVLFVSAPDLFLKIRASFNSESVSERDIVEAYTGVDYLFIDDIGAEKVSEWSRSVIYLIIDKRDREMLPTIITSNLSPAQIGEAIDGRISSRLANGKIVEIKMPDYRLKR